MVFQHSTIVLSPEHQNEIEEIMPGTFHIYSADDCPSYIPDGLRTKCDHIVVAASGSNDGNTYIMANCHRVDEKASYIDQEPMLAVLTSGGAHSCATFIHHGDWTGRSYNPGPEYWADVKASGIGACLGATVPAGVITAPIEELSDGDEATFVAIIDRIISTSGG